METKNPKVIKRKNNVFLDIIYGFLLTPCLIYCGVWLVGIDWIYLFFAITLVIMIWCFRNDMDSIAVGIIFGTGLSIVVWLFYEIIEYLEHPF